jgi:hypothetical protein
MQTIVILANIISYFMVILDNSCREERKIPHRRIA